MSIQERLHSLVTGAPPEADAVVGNGVTYTWQQLATCVAGLDSALDDLGLGAGARVGMVLESSPQFMSAAVGVVAGNRCITTLSPLQPPERLCADIVASELPVVVVSPGNLAHHGVREAVERFGRVVVLDEDGTSTLLPAGEGAVASTERRLAPGTIIEMYTSGTTGAPKRVQITYEQMDVGLEAAHITYKTGPDGQILLSSGTQVIVTPLVHIGGLWNALGSMYAGRRLVLFEKFAVEPWVDAIARYRPSAGGLVPAAIRMVLDAGVDPEKLSSLQVITSGTAPCPPELADAFFRTFGVRVLMTYGATEFAGAVAGWTKPMHIEFWDTKQGAAGRPFPGVTLRVVDEDGTEKAPGEPGILEIKAPQAPNLGRDFIRTSDLARVDADGFLWIDGRADDAIIRGGFKVHPPVVKRALESHPSVAEASVLARPDERLGSVPVAAVELRPGRPVPTVEELRALAKEKLLPYEVPAEIRIVDELPRTAAMKVDRLALRALMDAPAGTAGAVT